MACKDSLHFPTSLEMYVTCCVKFDTDAEKSVLAAPRRPHISLVTVTSYDVCVCVWGGWGGGEVGGCMCACVYMRVCVMR